MVGSHQQDDIALEVVEIETPFSLMNNLSPFVRIKARHLYQNHFPR